LDGKLIVIVMVKNGAIGNVGQEHRASFRLNQSQARDSSNGRLWRYVALAKSEQCINEKVDDFHGATEQRRKWLRQNLPSPCTKSFSQCWPGTLYARCSVLVSQTLVTRLLFHLTTNNCLRFDWSKLSSRHFNPAKLLSLTPCETAGMTSHLPEICLVFLQSTEFVWEMSK
jgi:hypothetical protein